MNCQQAPAVHSWQLIGQLFEGAELHVGLCATPLLDEQNDMQAQQPLERETLAERARQGDRLVDERWPLPQSLPTPARPDSVVGSARQPVSGPGERVSRQAAGVEQSGLVSERARHRDRGQRQVGDPTRDRLVEGWAQCRGQARHHADTQCAGPGGKALERCMQEIHHVIVDSAGHHLGAVDQRSASTELG